MRTEPMIACRSVRASSAWYCELFEATHDHDSDEFDRILRGGRLLLMLHHWGGEEHGASLFDPDAGPVGNGVVLWFLVEDLGEIYQRAVAMGATIVEKPHDNPMAHWREFSMRDPDGYTLAIAETGWDD